MAELCRAGVDARLPAEEAAVRKYRRGTSSSKTKGESSLISEIKSEDSWAVAGELENEEQIEEVESAGH